MYLEISIPILLKQCQMLSSLEEKRYLTYLVELVIFMVLLEFRMSLTRLEKLGIMMILLTCLHALPPDLIFPEGSYGMKVSTLN